MKRIKVILLLVPAVLFVTAGLFAADQHKYVGVATCKMCHKAQYEVWIGTLHSKAFENLKGEAALKIAAEKKMAKPPAESDECLKCHTTAFGVDAAMLEPKFDKSMGVQCEACHGPGSDYKSMPVMKDVAKAHAAGLADISAAGGTAEKHCVKCHNQESPTFKSFNFKEYWDKIKHPKPAK